MNRSGSGDALKGHLDLLVLATVAAGARHGYAVIDALRLRSGGLFNLPEGTIYPVLHRLEAQGLLKSSWDRSASRPRRVYRLTRFGRSQLEDKRSAWVSFADAIGAVLEGT